MARGSNQKDPHVELNKKSQFINIYFLAANAINMLHVNNNCADIFWKFFFRDLFSGCRCYKGSGINVRKKRLPYLCSGHYFFGTDFARKSNYQL